MVQSAGRNPVKARSLIHFNESNGANISLLGQKLHGSEQE